jgi:hypothetical protein
MVIRGVGNRAQVSAEEFSILACYYLLAFLKIPAFRSIATTTTTTIITSFSVSARNSINPKSKSSSTGSAAVSEFLLITDSKNNWNTKVRKRRNARKFVRGFRAVSGCFRGPNAFCKPLKPTPALENHAGSFRALVAAI